MAPFSNTIWRKSTLPSTTYFGEKDLTGLVYSDKPSITFTQAEITATKNLGTENDNTHYYTTYTFGCDVSGGFWIKSADYYMDGQGWTTFWDTSFFYSDENYFYDCYLDYYSNQQMYHKDYFIITLKNGKTIYSTNSLIWGGSPNSPSVYIDNATKNNMLKQSIAINPQKNLGKMHLQKIYVYSAETTIFIQESAE